MIEYLAFGVGSPNNSFIDDLPLYLFGITMFYILLMVPYFFVTSLTYIVMRFVKPSLALKKQYTPEVFIVIQSVIFPLYFMLFFVATIPINERDYDFKFYVFMYSVAVIIYMVAYNIISTRIVNKKQLNNY